MATYGYMRVSTAGQVDDESLKTQRRQVTGWSLQNDRRVTGFFTESVSASVPFQDRPQGRVLLAQLKSGDTLVASKLDRVFRSARDALTVIEQLQKRNVDVVLLDMGGSVLHDSMSRFFFTMLSAFAEFERTRIADRIREVKQDQRARRLFSGAKPFGWTVFVDPKGVKRLRVDILEQSAFPEIFALRKQGRSLHSIAAALRKRGISISHVTVKRILDGKVRPASADELKENA